MMATATGSEVMAFIEQGICTHVIVDEQSGILTYCPPNRNNCPVGIFQGKKGMSQQNPHFEIQIVNTGRNGTCSIGLIQNAYPENNQPGWRKWSIGYHADDGFIYANGTQYISKSGPCQQGDILGIRVEGLINDCVTRGKLMVSFYKNRQKVGEQMWPAKVKHVFPAVGFHSSGEQVKLLHYRCTSQQIPIDFCTKNMIQTARMTLVDFIEPDTLTYRPLQMSSPVGVFKAKHSLTRQHNYFELRIDSLGQNGCISIGVAHSAYSMRSQPGWLFGSVGYHADDQGLYYNDGYPIEKRNTTCARGDVMGCGFEVAGVHFNADGTPSCNQILKIYFIRNGSRVHLCNFYYHGGGIHPTVGMHSPGEKVQLLQIAGEQVRLAEDPNRVELRHAPLRRLSAGRLSGASPDGVSTSRFTGVKGQVQNNTAVKSIAEVSPLSLEHLGDTGDMFICSVCLDPYDEENHQPKLLPCHHTFCTECLLEILGSGDCLQCPSCRLSVDLPKGEIASLQTNFYINNAMELLVSMKERMSVNSMNEEMSIAATQQKGCKNHSNQPLSFYCKTCSEAICRDCTVLKHSMSSGHNVVDISDMKQECIKVLQKREGNMERALAASEKQRKDLEMFYGNLNIKRDQTYLWVDAVFDRYVEIVNESRAALKQDIEQCYQSVCDNINVELKHSVSNTEHLSMAKNHIGKLIHSDNVHKIIDACDDTEVDECTEKILETTCKAGRQAIKFVSESGEEKLRECLQGIGKITVDY